MAVILTLWNILLCRQFAIRPSFRHHHELERRNVIDLVAALIDQNRHKVDLVNPDKVILIEIFRVTLYLARFSYSSFFSAHMC